MSIKDKVLFIHSEEKMKTDSKGNYYTDGCYNDTIWKRYLDLSQNLTVIFRKENKIYDERIASKKYNKIPNGVSISVLADRKESIKKFLSIKTYFDNKEILKDNIINSSFIILRTPSEDSYLAAKIARKYKKNYLVEVVGCPFDTLWHHGIKGKILAIPNYFKMKKCVKNAKNVLYVSEKFLQNRYPTNGNKVSCSDVDLKGINYNKIVNRGNKKKTDQIIIGTIGNVDLKYKGQSDVIKALAILEKKGYTFKYKLVGSGNKTFLTEKSKQYGFKNIEFIGSIPHNSIYDFFNDIDIYIHPSYTEGLCRSLIEAISVGCPCIASNAGGNIELVDKEYIYKKGNVNQLCEKIIEILSNDNLVKQSKLNMERSKKFLSSNLDSIRKNFYLSVLNEEGEKNDKSSTRCK